MPCIFINKFRVGFHPAPLMLLQCSRQILQWAQAVVVFIQNLSRNQVRTFVISAMIGCYWTCFVCHQCLNVFSLMTTNRNPIIKSIILSRVVPTVGASLYSYKANNAWNVFWKDSLAAILLEEKKQCRSSFLKRKPGKKKTKQLIEVGQHCRHNLSTTADQLATLLHLLIAQISPLGWNKPN